MGFSHYEAVYGQIVAKAWTDSAFLEKLTAHPKEVLSEYGIHIPSAVTVSVRQNAESGNVEFAIPKKPAGINDEDLKKLLGPLTLKGCF